MKKSFFFLLLFLIANISFGQSSPCDSLSKEHTQLKQDFADLKLHADSLSQKVVHLRTKLQFSFSDSPLKTCEELEREIKYVIEDLSTLTMLSDSLKYTVSLKNRELDSLKAIIKKNN